MPYIFDQTEIDWPDDDPDFEPPEPTLDQFKYLSPPEWGGVAVPVSFAVLPLADIDAAPIPKDTPDWQLKQQRHGQRLIATVVPAMRALGVQCVFCRYDGGNDEGFAWIEAVSLNSGQRLEAQQLLDKLSGSVGGGLNIDDFIYGGNKMSKRDQMRYLVCDALATEWASMMLGWGFGTGEYVMYGAFTVDLDTSTIVDDPHAAAITKNLTLTA